MAGLLLLVEGVGLQVNAVVEVVPRRVGLVVAGNIVDDHNLGLCQHFFAGRDIHRTVDNLAPHVEPDALEVGEGAPVAAGVAIDLGIVLVLEALAAPDKLRTVPDGTAVDAALLHHGTDAGAAGILALVLAYQLRRRVVPATVVVADAVVLGQTRDKRAPADALVVVEAAGVGVLVEEHDALGILLTGGQEVLVGLQLAHRVGAHVVVATAPAHGEETAVLVRHLHQIGKQSPTAGCRHRTHVAGIAEGPELLGVVPAEEVGIGLEEVLKGLEVGVLDVGVATRCGLAREPHAVLLTDRCPRLVGAHSVTGHAVHTGLGVELTRQRQVHADVGLDVGRNEVDNLLRVGRVPHVDVYQPQGMLVVNGTALLRVDGLRNGQQGQQEKGKYSLHYYSY